MPHYIPRNHVSPSPAWSSRSSTSNAPKHCAIVSVVGWPLFNASTIKGFWICWRKGGGTLIKESQAVLRCASGSLVTPAVVLRVSRKKTSCSSAVEEIVFQNYLLQCNNLCCCNKSCHGVSSCAELCCSSHTMMVAIRLTKTVKTWGAVLSSQLRLQLKCSQSIVTEKMHWLRVTSYHNHTW